MQRLSSDDTQERREAAYELADLGPDAKEAVPALIKALDDRDTQVWAEATGALARIGPDAAAAVDELMSHLGSRDRQRWYRTAHALGKIGEPALTRLRESLQSEASRLRAGSALALGWMGESAAPATNELVVCLGDEDDETRQQASDTLWKIGVPAVEALQAALDHDSPVVRAGAAYSLAHLDSVPDAVAQRLRELVADENVDVRSRAIEALASVAAEDPANLPALVQAMRDSNESVGQAAVAACLSVSPSLQERGVPLLAELLSADETTRRRVAYVLGRIGPKAAVAVSALIDVYSQNPDGDSPYASALSRIGTEAMSPLVQAVKDGRLSAAQVAGIFANMPMDAQEQLLTNLGHAEAPMREIAARSVGRLVPAPSEAVDRLAELLDDQVPQVRAAAAAALGNLGSASLSVEKSLAEAAADTDGAVRAPRSLRWRRLARSPRISRTRWSGRFPIPARTYDDTQPRHCRRLNRFRKRQLSRSRSCFSPIRIRSFARRQRQRWPPAAEVKTRSTDWWPR